MADLVSAIGIQSYNGVIFGPKTKTEIEGQSVLSQDGRTISYIIYTITIRTIIALDQQSTDLTMAAIRQLLQSPGGMLVIADTGFGPLVVNFDEVVVAQIETILGDEFVDLDIPVGPRDVLWGPIPKVLRWEPLGGGRACRITWTCQVAIPECPNAIYAFGLMEVNTKYKWDIDDSGYTTRTFSGFLRIPQTRVTQATRTLTDNADDYRGRIIPPPILGFRRKMSFDLNDSKCRLDFSVTDEQMPPNAPPLGAVKARASHTVRSPMPTAQKWTGTISGTYEMAQDVPRAAGYIRFLEFINDRILAASQFAQLIDGNRTIPMVLDLTMIEPEVFGRESASFSVTYTFFSTLENILNASGLWRTPPNSNYAIWTGAQANGVFSQSGRSYAGMGFQNSQEAIIDLCQQPGVVLADAARLASAVGSALLGLRNVYPDPSNSWMDYQSEIRIRQKDYNVPMKSLPKAQTQQLTSTPQSTPLINPTLLASAAGSLISSAIGGGSAAQLAIAAVKPTTGFTAPYVPKTPTSDVQVRALPDFIIELVGSAVRAGYQITPPILTSYDGKQVYPINDGQPVFAQKFVTSLFGVPIYSAAWHFKYLLTQVPVSPGIPPSPFMGQ